ncbi:unnamed protein product [Echinostoma caproni]|uniref:Uncharacterized protein n=1 Tax=Echinostoma caproni TaxID=27848 RepID=A0A3P8GQT8_9TREM|nr:unnamed protein product [Echinostoma caproni]
MAFTYSHGKRFAECSALLSRAKHHAEEAVHSLSPDTAPWTSLEASAAPGPSSEQLTQALSNTLLVQIAAEDLTCRAVYMLDLSDSTGGTEPTVPTETEGKLTNKTIGTKIEILGNKFHLFLPLIGSIQLRLPQVPPWKF